MNKHLLTLIAGLTLCAGQAFAQEPVEKTFDCVADTWIRSNSENASGSSNTSLEFRKDAIKDGDAVVGYANWVALLGFDYSVPAGKRVESATLRLMTERNKGGDISLRGFSGDVSDNSTWATAGANVEIALKNTPISIFNLAGQYPKALFDGGINADKKNLDAWTNNIDVTAYIQSLGASATRANFMLSQDGETATNDTRIYSKDNTGCVTKDDWGVTFTSDQLKPVLIVKYVEDANTLNATLDPAADTFVRSTAASNKYGTSADMEMYWKEDDTQTRFYGLMSFKLPADVLDGTYEVTSARLRLVNTQCKGDRNMDIYKYPTELDEANASWSTEADNMTEALSAAPIATFVAKGQGTKRMDDGGITDEYKDVAAWTNYIDLTDYIKANPSNLNILITRNKANAEKSNDAMRIATKEAKDYVNTKTDAANPFTFKAEDLKPQLYLTYSKADGGDTSAIEVVEMEDIDAPVEYYTLQGIRVENPGHGLYIVKKGNKVTKIVL